MDKIEYWFEAKGHVVRISPHGKRWRVFIDDELLDEYAQPHLALDDLTGGHGSLGPGNLDSATLGLPDELQDWHRRRLIDSTR